MPYEHKIAYLPYEPSDVERNADFLDRLSAEGNWEPFAASTFSRMRRVGTKLVEKLDQIVYLRRVKSND